MAEDATYFDSPDAWASWLAEHAGQQDAIWVGFHKKRTGEPSLTWDEAVDEALCHGWIDGIRQRVDDRRYRIRFTPRRSRSQWSAKNVRRVTELEAAGRMLPAGRAAFEARSGDPAGYSLEQRTATTLPAEYQRELEANAAAREFFEAQPPGYRRDAIHWVTEAKREATRERRLASLIEDSANGLRIKPLRRPDGSPR